MAGLEEITLITRIEIDEFDNVHVRRSTRILKDGVQIGEDAHHRHVVNAHDGTDDMGEDKKVRAVLKMLREEKAKP